MTPIKRRKLLKLMATGAATLAWPFGTLGAARPLPADLIQKPIPAGKEALTVIGMGTWRTFNVGSDPLLREQRTQVLDEFFQQGGQMVDSSPMYGSSQDVMGYALDQLGYPDRLFAAEKVWTRDPQATRRQIAESAGKWGLRRFDLMQVHNLLGWEAHLDRLQEMKSNGEIRYVGITTSHGRRHREFEQIMRRHDLDFVQLTYNPVDRAVEERLLPLARERGIAVIANRPFAGGGLVKGLQRRRTTLPRWAAAIGCRNWPQLLLKFTVSHPAVTCAIPATTQVEHMRENMGAARGELPDGAMRLRIIDAVRNA